MPHTVGRAGRRSGCGTTRMRLKEAPGGDHEGRPSAGIGARSERITARAVTTSLGRWRTFAGRMSDPPSASTPLETLARLGGTSFLHDGGLNPRRRPTVERSTRWPTTDSRRSSPPGTRTTAASSRRPACAARSGSRAPAGDRRAIGHHGGVHRRHARRAALLRRPLGRATLDRSAASSRKARPSRRATWSSPRRRGPPAQPFRGRRALEHRHRRARVERRGPSSASIGRRRPSRRAGLIRCRSRDRAARRAPARRRRERVACARSTSVLAAFASRATGVASRPAPTSSP